MSPSANASGREPEVARRLIDSLDQDGTGFPTACQNIPLPSPKVR
jgi:hypothetical protein